MVSCPTRVTTNSSSLTDVMIRKKGKNVIMISIYHGDKMRQLKTKWEEENEKPATVLDLKDQILHA
jgi:hypothetical protein